MMATVEATHVEGSAELLGEEPEAQEEHSSNHGDSDEGSEGGGSDDGGTDDEGASEDREDKEAGDDDDDDGAEAGDEDGGEEGEGEGEEGNQNAGWAEAMAKILGKKTPDSKPSILLKNKQLDKQKEKEKQEQLERKKQVDKKRSWEMMGRDKPDLVKDREMERNLQRIATRGVVQLFNAVRKHQKQVDEKVKEVGGSERRKAKLLSSISKKDFINVLRGTDGDVPVKKERKAGPAVEEEDEKPTWSVLRDDFMMGASMKDWDKESDAEDGDAADTQPASAVGDSDSD